MLDKIEKISGIIYKVIFLLTNKIYIGQTILTLKQRKNIHLSDSKNNRDNIYFHRALRKYGIENTLWIEIDHSDSYEKLNYLEEYWIKFYNCTNHSFGYNIKSGGNNHKISDTTKNKISIKNSGYRNGMYGKKRSEYAKLKTSQAMLEIWKNPIKRQQRIKKHIGFKRTNETKLKLSLSKIGLKNPRFNKIPHNASLTNSQVIEIKNIIRNTILKNSQIAKMYNVSSIVIYLIRKGKNYVNIK